jgi:aspartate 1-decarboxylase
MMRAQSGGTMQRTLLASKLHRVTTTAAELNYIGSCAIDQDLLDIAGIYPYEQIHIWNVNTGARLITYAIDAPRGSGMISVNGSAARQVAVGDILIIATFGQFTPTDALEHQPNIVFVDQANRVITQSEANALGRLNNPVSNPRENPPD